MYVNDEEAFNLEFTVNRDAKSAQRKETLLVSSALRFTLTSMATATTLETSVSRQYSLISILAFPLDVLTVASLIVLTSYSTYRWGRSRKGVLRQQDAALAGYLARLEELRSRNEISQATYERLKDEYWARIEGSIDHDK